jgi:hypothetical protein
MNAFLDKRIAVLERELLESREPTIVIIRGALPADQQPAIAQTVDPIADDSTSDSGCPLTPPADRPIADGLRSPTATHGATATGRYGTRRSPPTTARRSLSFVQAAGESAERFYDRVLAEAGEAPFVVFGGLQDQGELPPIYRSEL